MTGFWPLVRLALRRDRLILPAWVAVFVAMIAASASATAALYPNLAERVMASASVNAMTSVVALYGRIYDPASLGALATLKMTGFGAALVGVLAMLTVVRHTRAEEESSRLELLLGASVIGRKAPLAAAVFVAVMASAAIGLLAAIALVANGFPAAGSSAFGLAWCSAGVVFAAVGAVSAQLTRSARTANAISIVVLAVAYLARAAGDTAGSAEPGLLSWLSPIGWAQQLRPYAGEQWWVLILPAVLTVFLLGAAFVLLERRDFAAGMLAERAGPARATRLLHGPFGLAWRQQRSAVLGWTAGFAVLGAVFGSAVANVGSMLDSPNARALITALGGQQNLVNAFLAMEFSIGTIIVSVYGVHAVLRLHTEESALRVEPLLATGLTRSRLLSGYLIFAGLGSAAMLAAFGLTAGLSYGAQTGDLGGETVRLFGSAMAHLPAVLVVIALTVVAFGLLPRFAPVVWGLLVAFLVIGELGPLLELDQLIMDLSPFTHIPKLPGAEFTAMPILWLTGLAVVLCGAGFAAFRRRDIT